MGQLESFADQTGQMDPTEVNAQNIQNLLDEFNRSQDLLDALNTTPKIVNRGQASGTWNGTSNLLLIPSIDIGASPDNPLTYLCYMERSDQPGKLFSTPYVEIDTSGKISKIFQVYIQENFFNFFLVFPTSGSSITFTFSYFILQQPANVST